MGYIIWTSENVPEIVSSKWFKFFISRQKYKINQSLFRSYPNEINTVQFTRHATYSDHTPGFRKCSSFSEFKNIFSEYHENLFNNDFFCAVEETESLHIQVDDHVSIYF